MCMPVAYILLTHVSLAEWWISYLILGRVKIEAKRQLSRLL